MKIDLEYKHELVERPVVGITVPAQRSRKVPLMLNPVPWFPVDIASRPKYVVESRM